MSRNGDFFQIVIAGLSGSGKTTFIEHLLGKKTPHPATPTMGMDVLVEEINGHSFFIYDLGGKPNFWENFWRITIPKADAIIYLIDSTAPDLFPVIKKNLEMVLEQSPPIPILILANKQDLPIARGSGGISLFLQLDELRGKYQKPLMTILAISALTGYGLTGARNWLMKALLGSEKPSRPIIFYGAYLYDRETGLPLGLLFPPKSEDWSSQFDQATLISAFYAAFNNFSRNLIKTETHSILLRGNADTGSPDCIFFHSNDSESSLGLLFISNIIEERILESIAMRLFQEIKKIKQEQEVGATSSSTTVIDLYPLINQILEETMPELQLHVEFMAFNTFS